MADLVGAAGWWQDEINLNSMHSKNQKRRAIENKNAKPYILEMNHVLLEPNVTATWILMGGKGGLWSPLGGVNHKKRLNPEGTETVIQKEVSQLFLRLSDVHFPELVSGTL